MALIPRCDLRNRSAGICAQTQWLAPPTFGNQQPGHRVPEHRSCFADFAEFAHGGKYPHDDQLDDF